MTAVRTQSSTTKKVLGYPLNIWYVAAWDKEVSRKPISRKVAGRPLALYRTEEGKAVALADAAAELPAPRWRRALHPGTTDPALLVRSCRRSLNRTG
ncbi:vanillate O-demethylase monooxygenase subunit [Arthrobacter sp. 31Cvi3.1E]|nr:vanillate O-demethylase monooxygenase subunit [Arthrobacter sp. 31Cvi3.1E]